MDLRTALHHVSQDGTEQGRRQLYHALLGAELVVRGPDPERWAVSRPDGGRRAVPAFLTEAEARAFWERATPGQPIALEWRPFLGLASEARAIVLDPLAAGVLLDRSELKQLAAGEIPGDFAAWMRDFARLQRLPAEVAARLKQAHLHVLTGPGPEGRPQLYLLSKSDDGTTALPCFSSAETLAQFADVRRLREGETRYGAALYSGSDCLRIAAGLGAYVLVDPESPWETQIDPPLLEPGRLS